MSRVAKNPIEVPSGVEVKIDAQHVTVKGAKGTLAIDVHESVGVVQEDSQLLFSDLSNGGTGHATPVKTSSIRSCARWRMTAKSGSD